MPNLVGAWTTGSVLTNPSNGDVLVDSGPMSAVRGGWFLVGVIASAGLVAGPPGPPYVVVYDLQIRNATNTVTLQSQRRRMSGMTPDLSDDLLLPNKISMHQNERLRCVLVGGITGEVQMSLFTQEAL